MTQRTNGRVRDAVSMMGSVIGSMLLMFPGLLFRPNPQRVAYQTSEGREQIFDEARLSPLEKRYAHAYKVATGKGERSRGAHLRALEAVFEHGMAQRHEHPVRTHASALLNWLGQKVSP